MKGFSFEKIYLKMSSAKLLFVPCLFREILLFRLIDLSLVMQWCANQWLKLGVMKVLIDLTYRSLNKTDSFSENTFEINFAYMRHWASRKIPIIKYDASMNWLNTSLQLGHNGLCRLWVLSYNVYSSKIYTTCIWLHNPKQWLWWLISNWTLGNKSNYKNFHAWKYVWKCRLHCGLDQYIKWHCVFTYLLCKQPNRLPHPTLALINCILLKVCLLRHWT